MQQHKNLFRNAVWMLLVSGVMVILIFLYGVDNGTSMFGASTEVAVTHVPISSEKLAAYAEEQAKSASADSQTTEDASAAQ